MKHSPAISRDAMISFRFFMDIFPATTLAYDLRELETKPL
jgi:hypothetical protein